MIVTERKIYAMYAIYGHDPKRRKCADCPHFIETMPTDRKYFKCSVYGESSSESTDWRKGYEACSLIDLPFPEREKRVIDWLKHNPRCQVTLDQVEGQMRMEGL